MDVNEIGSEQFDGFQKPKPKIVLIARLRTIRLFFKKRNRERNFLGFGLLKNSRAVLNQFRCV